MNLDEVTRHLKELNNWALETNSISKEYQFSNFTESVDFVNKVKDISEKHSHHPDILIKYNRVFLILTTHSAKGLTEKDFEVAKDIDGIKI